MNFLPIIKSVIGQSPSEAPDTPTGLALTVVDHDTLTATFNAVSGATYYEYKIASSQVALGSVRWSRVMAGTAFTVHNLLPSTEYFAVVRSGNSSGTSAPTSAVSATTHSTIRATFSAVPQTIRSASFQVKVVLSESVTGFTVHDLLLHAVSGNGITGVMITSVAADSEVTNGYVVTISIPASVFGELRLGINTTAAVTFSGNTILVTGNSVRVVYDRRTTYTGNGVFEVVNSRARHYPSLAGKDNNLYGIYSIEDRGAIGRSRYNYYLEQINPDTGLGVSTFQDIRLTSSSLFLGYVGGFTFVGNTLYVAFNAGLHTVNLTTRAVTRVGSATNYGLSFAPNFQALAAIGNTLYAVSNTHTDNALYTINTTTGVATKVGSATDFGVNERDVYSLTSIGNVLYMIGRRNNRVLYILNTTTGVATRVGNAVNFGLDLIRSTGLDPFGLAAIGGTLYLSGFNYGFLKSPGSLSSVEATFSLSSEGYSTANRAYITNTPEVNVVLSESVSNLGIADFALSGIPEGIDAMITSVVADPDVTNGYKINLSISQHGVNGSFTLAVAPHAAVTHSGSERALTGDPITISYRTPQLLTVRIEETVVNSQARTASTRFTISQTPDESLAIKETVDTESVIKVTPITGLSHALRGGSNLRVNGVTHIVENTYTIDWTVAGAAGGQVSFEISGPIEVFTRWRSFTPRRTNAVLERAVGSFTFEAYAGVTAGITAPPLPITTTRTYADVRFSQVVSDFTEADVDISGDNSADVIATDVIDLPGGTQGQDYRVILSIANDTIGTADIDITGNVTFSSESVPVLVGATTIRWNTVQPISATMSVPMPGRLDTTAVSRVTFERPINVDSFATGDISVTAPMGVVVRNVVRVNTGGTRDFEFDITFALPANQAATASFDITGTITEGTLERNVIADSQDFTFNTVPRTIQASFGNLPTQPVGGNFTVDVNFSANTGQVITGFTAADVSASGDITGLAIGTVVGVAGEPHVFRIPFTPSVDTEGTASIGINGVVLLDGVAHAVIITPVEIRYDTRNAIMATWDGIDGIKRASPFTIELIFSGSEAVAIPDSTHFDITRISGDTIANLGISDYTIRRKTGSNQIFELIFTPAENVEGVFEIDATGRFNVGARGSQVMRDVSVPPARISVNTTNTIPQPIFDPSTIPTPIWDYLGDSDYTPPTEINQAGVDAFFRFSFGENVTGLTTDEIIEAGVENRTITLFRVVGSNRVLHTDPSVPHHLFDVAVRINAMQHGVLTLAIARNAVVSVDDNTPGPIVPIQRAGIPFDTRPTAAPIHIVRWDLPDMPSDGATVTASVYFSRALVAPESLLPSDIELDGITGASVRSVDVNASDPTRYDIVINIPLGSRGNLNIAIVGM